MITSSVPTPAGDGAPNLGAAETLLEAAIAAGELPGAVLMVGQGPDVWREWVQGAADLDGSGHQRPMRADTLFDLASLTKVVATLPAVLCLVGTGQVGLDDAVARHLPAFGAAGKESVTVRQLLTHTSGLPAHRELWRDHTDAAQVLQAALTEPLEDRPGSLVRYSDLGFIALGALIARVSGRPLAAAVSELVLGPLGLSASGYLPTGAPAAGAAATEPDPDGRVRVGVVHDENAAALGGVAGHAGLFGTAADLACYLSAWCPVSGSAGAARVDALFPAALRAAALRCQTAGLGGHRALGWTARGDAYDHLGTGWPETAVGHTGFTGTSLALDPASGVFAVLCTNAVRFGRSVRMVALRREVHSAIAASVSFTGPE